MKLRYLTLTTALIAVIALSWMGCSKKAEEHEHDEAASDTLASEEEMKAAAAADWKEMDAFHTIMAEAFHPFKDSANLAPAKMHAEELATSAAAWQAAPLPAKVDNEEVKTKLESLKAGTAAFVETVKGGNDEAIGKSLTQLHDQFHELQEAWYAGHDHEHHH